MLLAKKIKKLWFSTDRDTVNQIVDGDYGGSKTVVEVAPLDEMVGDKHPIAIKLDVEGNEYEALEGASNTLSNMHLKVVLAEDNSAAVRRILLGSGFVECSYDPSQRKLVETKNPPKFNHIWIKDVEWVADRVQKAQEFSVLGELI